MANVAALFVDSPTIYAEFPGVDCWPEPRDARKYCGPYPVVAHPPCERWGRMYKGGLRWRIYNNGEGKKLGDDDGCFASALKSVREFGGVLEHPEGSHAFEHFFLKRPTKDGYWHRAGDDVGYVACVDQGWYGHPARKFTWLYAVVDNYFDLPSLPVGDSGKKGRIMFPLPLNEYRAKKNDESLYLIEAWQKASTPIQFAEMLLSIARAGRMNTVARNDANALPVAGAIGGDYTDPVSVPTALRPDV